MQIASGSKNSTIYMYLEPPFFSSPRCVFSTVQIFDTAKVGDNFHICFAICHLAKVLIQNGTWLTDMYLVALTQQVMI